MPNFGDPQKGRDHSCGMDVGKIDTKEVGWEGMWIGFIWLMIGNQCGYGNEPLGSVNGEELLGKLSDC
jgi:hypothetical protein